MAINIAKIPYKLEAVDTNNHEITFIEEEIGIPLLLVIEYVSGTGFLVGAGFDTGSPGTGESPITIDSNNKKTIATVTNNKKLNVKALAIGDIMNISH